MDKRSLKVIQKILIACLLISFSAVSRADEETDALRKLKQVQQQINQVQTKLNSVEQDRDKLNNTLREAERSIGKLHNQIRSINQDIDSNQRQINQLKADKAALVKREIEQRDIMREHIVAVYSMGRQSRLKLILNEENPEQISRTLVYYESLRDARQEVIASYRDTLAQLERIGPQLTAQQQALTDNRNQLEEQRSQLNKQQATRKETIAQLTGDIADKQKQLTQLKRDRDQLEDVIKALQEAIANMKLPNDFAPFTSRKGKLNWPVKGTMENRFGAQRSADIKWQGITLSANEGTPIKAIHSGRVVFADWLKGYGLLIIVDHGEDYLSLYANNQSLTKNLGDWVNSTDTIATLGRSGGLAQASVYFEIRHEGQAVNPSQWCK
jgi:septal ring factor EnvC (AmiA/AmiB activator)